MCRNIKTLANFEPPASDDEVRASALQFVRKLSGTTRPSRANEQVFERAVDEVTAAARTLLQSLQTNAAPRDRAEEARKARSGRESASPERSASAFQATPLRPAPSPTRRASAPWPHRSSRSHPRRSATPAA